MAYQRLTRGGSRRRSPQGGTREAYPAKFADPAGYAALSRPTENESKEVIEVMLGAHLMANAENLYRRDRRIEQHGILGSVPEVARAGDQLVHLVRRTLAQTERLEREAHA